MTIARLTAPLMLAALAVSLTGLQGCGGGGDGGSGSGSATGGSASNATRSGGSSKMSADDKAAADFVQSKIDATWLKTADGWVTQMYQRNMFGERMDGLPEVLFLQYRDMKFSVSPVALTESQKLNGTTYRAEISFEYVPTRRYHTEKSISAPPGWSPWEDEQPASALAVELRNGKWLITDAELFAFDKPDAAAIPK